MRGRIFCERLPELVAPYGRKTLRLNDVLLIIGFALGLMSGLQPCLQACIHRGIPLHRNSIALSTNRLAIAILFQRSHESSVTARHKK